MSRRPRVHRDYLEDILYAATKALEFTAGMSWETFSADDRTKFAVVQALQIIGEAATKVPAGLRGRYPDIPWENMAGMRNKLVHEYFGVAWEVVWRTVQDDVPNLRQALSRILQDPNAGLS